MYQLKMTYLLDKLITSSEEISSWLEVQKLIELQKYPTNYSLSDEDGNALIYLTSDGKQAHLSVWEASVCYYFCAQNANFESEDVIDIGWNSYPAWSVVSNLEEVSKAASAWVNTRKRVFWGNWKSEEIFL